MPAYDYIIVGGGTAGSVLAGKLSEDPDVTVLVLEAGASPEKILETRIPLLFSKLFHGTHDWEYYTTEQKAIANRKLYWPRGRMLGGCSSMNAMIYHHGSKSDFDEWATHFGCEGWGYDNLAPYFKIMEKFTPNPNRPLANITHRGQKGAWQTGYSYLNPIVGDGWIRACEEGGFQYKEDINTHAGTLGVTRLQSFISPKGERSSMATAYLNSKIQLRPNLFVAIGAHVTKILFDHVADGDQPEALGAQFQTARGSDTYQACAKKEVILAGGAVNTPQILKLSGIGPAEELRKHDIGVIRDNAAVGENLKDHLCCTGIMCKAKPGTTMDYLTNDIKAIPALLQWLTMGTGPLTSNVAEGAAFARSSEWSFKETTERNRPEDYGSGGIGPDVEFIGAPMAYVHHGEETAPPGVNVLSIVSIGLRPQSKGSIMLKNNDPFDHPIIDPKYWSDPDDNDRKVLLAGMRKMFQVMRSDALRPFLDPVPLSDDPTNYWWPYSCSDPDEITDETLLRFMKEKAFTLYHPVGTARMGPSESNSVVDLQCRVHGVKGLRVMDASIFPEQISGHPTAPIGALAYKLSDMIKAGN